MFFRQKKAGKHTYLQVVENRWDKGKVRQKVFMTVGRLDRLRESGKLDSLLASGARFSEKALVLTAHDRGETTSVKSLKIGPALLFEKLWKEDNMPSVLEKMLEGRKFRFSVERAVFLTVVHRLFASGSDRAAEHWKEGYAIDGVEDLDLHHLYRAMRWLGERLPDSQQDKVPSAGKADKESGRGTPPATRFNKDLIEEALFKSHRNLFSSVSMVFFDTTSIYFEGEGGGEDFGRRGNSKDHRPDLKQMVVGMVLDQDGFPLSSEMWPGSTADVKSLMPVVERLQKHFDITSFCIVSDRGMISEATVRELDANDDISYILGARMRSSRIVRDEVLARGGRYKEVHPERATSKDPSPLKVKEVKIDKKRYIICLNEAQARKDALDREAIIASLEEALSRGEKSLVGNKGYRRYVKSAGKETAFTVDYAKAEAEARYDGKWVLLTDTKLPAEEVALQYKRLWMVESVFRTMKSILNTRPIYHQSEEAIKGHVFCTFLALRMMVLLRNKVAEIGKEVEWNRAMQELDEIMLTDISHNNKGYQLRSDVRSNASILLSAARVKLPPTLSPIGDTAIPT